MNIQQYLKQQKQTLAKRKAMLKWIELHATEIEAIDVAVSVECGTLDFDWPTHEQTVAIMQLVQAGKWEKEYNEDTISYSAEKDSISFRIYGGKPPPHCQIVEVPKVQPAQPERVVMKKKLVCTGENS